MRFSATIGRPASGIGLRIDASFGSGRTFSVPVVCDGRPAMSRCSTNLWVPPDAETASIVIWAAQETGDLFEPRIDVATRPQASRTIGPQVDKLVSRVRADYYRTDEVDWPALERTINAIPAPPDDLDPRPATAEFLRSRLPGNRHMFVWASALTTAPASTVALPTCSSTEEQIGVIALPGLTATSGDAPTAYAAALHDCLMTGSAERVWVVDLRGNTGGNMYPMIGGLAPLLPLGRLYAFANGHRETTASVGIDERGVTVNTRPAFESRDGGSRLSAPVIVVFGAHCGSSCEQTANALAARPRTLFVGEPSAGYLTGNIVLPINDDYVLLLTTGYTEDPCGRILEDRLRPDVAVDQVADRSVDELLHVPRVRTWLTARSLDRTNQARTTDRCSAGVAG